MSTKENGIATRHDIYLACPEGYANWVNNYKCPTKSLIINEISTSKYTVSISGSYASNQLVKYSDITFTSTSAYSYVFGVENEASLTAYISLPTKVSVVGSLGREYTTDSIAISPGDTITIQTNEDILLSFVNGTYTLHDYPDADETEDHSVFTTSYCASVEGPIYISNIVRSSGGGGSSSGSGSGGEDPQYGSISLNQTSVSMSNNDSSSITGTWSNCNKDKFFIQQGWNSSVDITCTVTTAYGDDMNSGTFEVTIVTGSSIPTSTYKAVVGTIDNSGREIQQTFTISTT